MAGLGHDAGVVSSIGEDEGDLGIEQQVYLEGGPPWGDVIGFSPDGERRHPNVG